MFSQRTGSFEELGWQEFELGKGWYEHWPRAKTGTGQRPRWFVWLPVSLQCRRQKQWGCRGMKGSIADYCQNWKRMITKPEAPEKLLVASQLWHSKGKVALEVEAKGMETGTDLSVGCCEPVWKVKWQNTWLLSPSQYSFLLSDFQLIFYISHHNNLFQKQREDTMLLSHSISTPFLSFTTII